MENKLLDMAAFKKLEKMPTKIEMIATIAGLIKKVSVPAYTKVTPFHHTTCVCQYHVRLYHTTHHIFIPSLYYIS